jgi:hypothetical protein
LQDLLIDGSFINAVVSLGGTVENKSTFKVLIEKPVIHVEYQGAVLGMVRREGGSEGGRDKVYLPTETTSTFVSPPSTTNHQ